LRQEHDCAVPAALDSQAGGAHGQGKIVLDGEDILTKSDREMQQIRGSKIAMILQDPQTSLNPVFTIGDQLREAIVRHSMAPRPRSPSASSMPCARSRSPHRRRAYISIRINSAEE
jgi:ABC-type dipeptide/oligopeptide/nickel transport system ATPase component